MLERAKERTPHRAVHACGVRTLGGRLGDLVDEHRRQDWLLVAVAKRLREELGLLQVHRRLLRCAGPAAYRTPELVIRPGPDGDGTERQLVDPAPLGALAEITVPEQRTLPVPREVDRRTCVAALPAAGRGCLQVPHVASASTVIWT